MNVSTTVNKFINYHRLLIIKIIVYKNIFFVSQRHIWHDIMLHTFKLHHNLYKVSLSVRALKKIWENIMKSDFKIFVKIIIWSIKNEKTISRFSSGFARQKNKKMSKFACLIYPSSKIYTFIKCIVIL